LGGVTTEQVVILGFLALAFLAGWIARALIGGGRAARSEASAREGRVERGQAAGSEPAGGIGRAGGLGPAGGSEPARTVEPAPASVTQRFPGAVHDSRDELARAIRAYHAAVVGTLGNGSDHASGQSTLEALAAALVALSRAVDHASGELEAAHPLTGRLQSTGVELLRLADDVMRHSRERELPAGVFDQLEQHLISAASMILSPDRLQPRAA
jgi:hypothetical protein